MYGCVSSEDLTAVGARTSLKKRRAISALDLFLLYYLLLLCIYLYHTVRGGTEIFLDLKKSQKKSAVVGWEKRIFKKLINSAWEIMGMPQKNSSCGIIYHVPGTSAWYERSCNVWLKKGGTVHTKNTTTSA